LRSAVPFRLTSAVILIACGIQAFCQGTDTTKRTSPDSGKAAPEYRRFLLNPKLFTPDERWTYDGSDKYPNPKARFGGALVAQKGSVSIGDNRWLNTGAFVQYQLVKHDSVAGAQQAFKASALPKPGRFARRTTRSLKAGDEARDESDTVVDERGEPVSYHRRVDVRYGAYHLAVIGSADMKTFGPAPASGSRRWLCEDVFDNVLKAALSRCSSELQPKRTSH
jgi:hypothetical protein